MFKLKLMSQILKFRRVSYFHSPHFPTKKRFPWYVILTFICWSKALMYIRNNIKSAIYSDNDSLHTDKRGGNLQHIRKTMDTIKTGIKKHMRVLLLHKDCKSSSEANEQ